MCVSSPESAQQFSYIADTVLTHSIGPIHRLLVLPVRVDHAVAKVHEQLCVCVWVGGVCVCVVCVCVCVCVCERCGCVWVGE